jgi:predicted deacylase
MELGIPAITVEIGNPGMFQKRFVKNALIGVTNIISSLRMIADDHDPPEYQPVICDRSFWIFTTRGGILNVIPEVNTWVKKGEVIATIHSIFGELIEEYKAPEDSIVIGKEIDPVASAGARIAHLGILTGSFATGKVGFTLDVTDFRLMMGICRFALVLGGLLTWAHDQYS